MFGLRNIVNIQLTRFIECQKEESTMTRRFGALIAEKIELPFTEKVEEQVVVFGCVHLKCLLDMQVEILSRLAYELRVQGKKSRL